MKGEPLSGPDIVGSSAQSRPPMYRSPHVFFVADLPCSQDLNLLLTYIHTRMHEHMQKCVCVCIYIYIYIRTYTNRRIDTHTYVRVSTVVCTLPYTIFGCGLQCRTALLQKKRISWCYKDTYHTGTIWDCSKIIDCGGSEDRVRSVGTHHEA